MADEPEELSVEDKLMQILRDSQYIVNSNATQLLDVHHNTVQHARLTIHGLRAIQDRFDEIVDNMVRAYEIGLNELGSLYADIITAEVGGDDDEDLDEDEEDDDSQ